MAAVTINDLHADRTLDRKVMSSIKGASGSWVFGWIRPHVPATAGSGFGQTVNYYQINNNYYVDQMNNQIQMIDVKNTAPNSSIYLDAGQHGTNIKH